MSLASRFSAAEFREWFASRRLGPFLAASAQVPDASLDAVHAASPRSGPDLLWMATSGTTSQATSSFPRRWIGHTRDSLRASAQAVGTCLQLDSSDRWARALPLHHMGGLSIEVRSEVHGLQAVPWDHSWDAEAFCGWLERERITLASLVPAQLHDLVRTGIRCPSGVRALVIGADRLSPDLLARAQVLGWPALPSYGMTETASMMACHSPGHAVEPGAIPLLSRVKATIDGAEFGSGRLSVETPSLFHAELHWDEKSSTYRFHERPAGAWPTEDEVTLEIHGDQAWILPRGRSQDFVKILGEGVHLAELDAHALELLRSRGYSGDCAFATRPDDRAGHRLVLVLTAPFEGALELWNSECRGLERAAEVFLRADLPRTELGKLKRSALLDLDS